MTNKEFVLSLYPEGECFLYIDYAKKKWSRIRYLGMLTHFNYWSKSERSAWTAAKNAINEKLLRKLSQ